MIANTTTIRGPEDLAAFRLGLTGECGLELLRQAAGRLLIQLPVGVGKSIWLRRIVEAALEVFSLVIVLAPRWDILDEFIAGMPKDIPTLVLRPRPRRRCGSLDAEWQELERAGCGALGRKELCGRCPRKRDCSWPQQYSEDVSHLPLVLGTQTQIVVNPSFLLQRRQRARAHKVLVLIDESDLLLKSIGRLISVEELDLFEQCLRSTHVSRKDANLHREWCCYTSKIQCAGTSDLKEVDCQPPPVTFRWAARVQDHGWKSHPQHYRFLGYDLAALARSDIPSRERLPDGTIRFAVRPDLGDAFIIFSGSVAEDLAQYRLDPDSARPRIHAPFLGLRFEHPGTRWFNIRSLTGSARHFPGNHEWILQFFSHLLARNIRTGRRTLLVARKSLVRLCAGVLARNLTGLGIEGARIVTTNLAKRDYEDPGVIPLINYGVCGINLFEDFDACYCLTGYYVPETAVRTVLHELEASPAWYEVKLGWEGNPRRRRIEVKASETSANILPRLAWLILQQREPNVIIQAVGRVRPFTRPREVITFHAGELPGVAYTLEFPSLDEARAYFEVPTDRQIRLRDRVREARLLRDRGLSRGEIASDLRINLSTVKRYLKE